MNVENIAPNFDRTRTASKAHTVTDTFHQGKLPATAGRKAPDL
jgi:hypothetical protein